MEIKNIGTKIKTDGLSCALSGILTAVIIMVVVSFVVSCIIFFSQLPEAYLQPAFTIISVVALFLGGRKAAAKAQEKGLLNGLVVGIFFAVIFLILTLVSGGSWLNWAMQSAYCILAAAIGGIFGVK